MTLPAETVWFQENVGTERCPLVGRSLDHQVLPVHLAPSRHNTNVTITNKSQINFKVIYIHTHTAKIAI